MTALPAVKRRAVWQCLAALLLLLFFALLNARVPSAGIVQDALLDTDNRYAKWNAEAARNGSIQQGEPLSFVLAFPKGLDHEGLAQIVRLSEAAKSLFPEGKVWSLSSNAMAYQAKGGALHSHAHLSAASLPALDLASWKAQVREDRSVYGTLVGEGFDYAQIMVFLPADYDEQGVVDRVAEFLEQRSISKLEWLLWKGDIRPVAEHANVSLGGWSVARGLMHYALIADVMLYSTIGLLLATLAAVFSLGSWRQALMVSTLIFFSFVVTRGAIPLMEQLGLRFYGLPVSERVYFLLVLSALIVSGISLFTRAFEAYNLQRRADPNAAPERLWQGVRPLYGKFNVVVLIAALNFATLPQIGIRGLLEVGVLSIVGLLAQRLMVSTLLPALHRVFGGEPGEAVRLQPAASSYQRAVQAVPRAAHALLQRLGPVRSLVLSLGLTGLTLAGALAVVAHDARVDASQRWISVQERPIDYLPGTIVDRGRMQLNQAGGAGFARLAFLVEGDTSDPNWLARTQAFQTRVQALAGNYPVRSMLDKLGEVAQKSPDVALPLPATRAQAHELQQLMRWDFEQAGLADYFWSDRGMVVFAAQAADNSRELREFADAVMQLATREFADLRVLPFGRLHTYHQTDEYISQGKPLNVLLSFPLVLGVAWLWLAWSQRGQRGQKLHNLRAALALCLPFVFAYALVVLVMAVFRLPLDQATACATALGINAAVDFGLYLLDDYRQVLARGGSPDEALRVALGERGGVTLIDAKLNIVCFSLLLASSFVPIQRLGLLLIVLLVACAFGVLLLMAGVLNLCVSKPYEKVSACDVEA